MTDYTELKARMLAWCDTCTTFGLDSIGQDVKAGLDAIEFLERQIAELSKEAVPVAWGIAVEDEMCDAYINKDACVREFDRRNKLYPDTPRILVDLFTSPPNTADIEQRVAEACAKLYKTSDITGDQLDTICTNWREYL